MSDQSGGPGWWLASDGRWYPPQPDPTMQTPLATAVVDEPSSSPWWKRSVPLWSLVLAGLIGIVLGAASAPSDDGKPESAANAEELTTTTEEPTASTRRSTTTTTVPTTTTAPTTTTMAPPPPPAEVEITRFEGSGQSTTRPFTVPDGWEIQWDASDFIQIYVYEASGELSGIAANQQGSGSGSAFQPSGGSFYLQMNAMGSWTVRVVDVN